MRKEIKKCKKEYERRQCFWNSAAPGIIQRAREEKNGNRFLKVEEGKYTNKLLVIGYDPLYGHISV